LIFRLTTALAFAASLVGSLSLASTGHATFVLPTEWSRGDSNSTYQEWDVFTNPPGPAGPFAPDIGVSNPNGAPTLSEVGFPDSGSLVTGSGNIYSFSAPTSFEITVPNFNLGVDFNTTVVLQTRVIGTQIDPATMLIEGIAPTAVETLPDPAAGSVETLWRWENLAGNDASYVIEFGASGSSMSFGAASVDTFAAAVPEPSTVAIGLIGLGAIAILRKRSQHAS
jgi:hypothetical protein